MFQEVKTALTSAATSLVTSTPTTLIAKGTLVVGDIHFHGHLEIEGEVEGNILVEGGVDARVRVLDAGLVRGEIHAPLVLVRGRVAGSIHATGYVHLHASAVVDGHIRYNVLEMEKGAQVNGGMMRDISLGAEPRKPNPTLRGPDAPPGNLLGEPPYSGHSPSPDPE